MRRISIKSLTAEIHELREELQALRKHFTAEVHDLQEEVQVLKKRVSASEQRGLGKDDEGDLIDFEPEPRTKKMGRKPRVSDDELNDRLDELLIRLEGIWAQFLSAREDAKDADEFAKLLEERLPYREGDLVFQKLRRHRQEMWNFMMCDRYNGTYQQFACAMAGVPDFTFRYSLNKCSELLASLQSGEKLHRRI
jgi:hypothetical protein